MKNVPLSQTWGWLNNQDFLYFSRYKHWHNSLIIHLPIPNFRGTLHQGVPQPSHPRESLGRRDGQGAPPATTLSEWTCRWARILFIYFWVGYWFLFLIIFSWVLFQFIWIYLCLFSFFYSVFSFFFLLRLSFCFLIFI